MMKTATYGKISAARGWAAAGAIRKLWIGEAPLYCAHLLRLDPESRRNRFGGTVSDDYIRGYVQAANLVDAVIHGLFVDGALREVAELRPSPGHEAEVALSVDKDWQGHGVGTALLERTLVAARNRGIKSAHMTYLAENGRVQKLARKFNADLKFGFGGVAGKFDVGGNDSKLSQVRCVGERFDRLPGRLQGGRSCARAGNGPIFRHHTPRYRPSRNKSGNIDQEAADYHLYLPF
jgi:GNAT superfamily N-acetyltransferase